MTFRDKFKLMIVGNGLFPEQAEEIMKSIENAEDDYLLSLQERLNDHIEGYPQSVLTVGWFVVKSFSLEWIEQNCPNAWCKPMFEV